MGKKVAIAGITGFWVLFASSIITATSLPPRARNAGQASGPKHGKTTFQELRVRESLNSGWLFKRQASPGAALEAEFSRAEQPDYDDSSWTKITLPHTWDATSDNPFPTTRHFRGLGWYRRRLDVQPEWRSRRVGLDFKGVFQVADVWVNGRHAGQHTGGFTGFQFDITDQLHWDAPNLLAVRVNDVLDPEIAPANETNVVDYGGIYRSVSLVVMDPLHIAPNGTSVTTEPAGDAILVRVRSWVHNAGTSSINAHLQTTVLDAANQPVATLEASDVVAAGEDKEFDQKTQPISGTHLWSPETPYLYRAVSTVSDGPRAADRYVTSFGIRFMGHDPSTGFTLNGKPINLHGVDRRQDYGFLGDAVPEAVGVRDVRLMKEMGVNFIRTSHYPQDPAVLEACDQLGILVWEEIPNIKIFIYPAAGDSHPGELYTERFPRALMRNLKQQLREMVERDRNHPSIIIWGLADDLSGYHYPEDFVELSNAAHALDSTRWTAGRAPHVTDIIDATTFSAVELLREHREHPERKYIWNEWGAFASQRGLEGDPVVGSGESVSMADSEAAQLLEGYLMQWNALPWLGTAKWCMFDTGEVNATQTRTVWVWPWPDGKVTFRWPFNDYLGVSDMWRLPKHGFYFLQSQWTEKPMVHIVGHWTWPGETGRKRQVRVYSNCDTVELVLNGRSLGASRPATPERVWQDFRQLIDRYRALRDWKDDYSQVPFSGATLRHSPFVWDDVPYENGSLAAIGHKGGETVRDELRTAGAPTRIVLKSEKATLAVNREDVSFLEADVADSNGTIVPDAHPWIRFTVEGPGRLFGGTTEIDAISGVAAINVQTTGQPGTIVVTATAEALAPGSVRIQATEE